MSERGTDAGPKAASRKSAGAAAHFTPFTRTRARARRAGFLEQFDAVAGPDGVTTLAEEGHDAHRVSDELHLIAQKNTPETARVMRRARRRHRVFVALIFSVFAVAALWVGDNVVGSLTGTHATRFVTSASVVRGVSGVANADCLNKAAVQDTWKAAAPFASVVPYRCGTGARGMFLSGPISIGAVVVALLSLLALAIARQRWRRTAYWY